MDRKVLITGAQGFIGSQLSLLLKGDGYSVHGPSADITDWEALFTEVKKERWDAIVHLAALSHMPTCDKDPSKAFQVNLTGTAMLLEAVRRHCPSAHFLFSSSAQIYARPEGSEIEKGVLFDETRKIVPQNLYGQTKWASELLLCDFAKREGTPVTILRLFNHTHRSQLPDFFLPHLYNLMKNHKPGTSVEIPVGNLHVRRDIGSSQDLVRAIRAILKKSAPKGEAQIFNVCSGNPKHLGTLAQKLADRLGLIAKFIVDPERVRPGEPSVICGSHRKLTDATGWVPHAKTEDQLIDTFLA
ncbi:MAG: NAD(P)-dependent oxidoreductase [Bdellovibrionota bacterium]